MTDCIIIPQVMDYTLNTNHSVAVSTEVFWMPIDKDTPRNTKVLAIARPTSGIVCIGTISNNEQWFTHWHPLPAFHPDDVIAEAPAPGSYSYRRP